MRIKIPNEFQNGYFRGLDLPGAWYVSSVSGTRPYRRQSEPPPFCPKPADAEQWGEKWTFRLVSGKRGYFGNTQVFLGSFVISLCSTL